MVAIITPFIFGIKKELYMKNDNVKINNRITLSRVLGRTDVLATGFGTMVGWSWIMMATTWITEAGFAGAIVAFLLGGSIILSIGMIYGELTAALPLAGGEFVFAYRAMGKKVAWFVGWMMSLSYIGVAAWEGIALATAVNYILPIPVIGQVFEIAGYQIHLTWALVGVAGAMIITFLNYFGTRPALLFQVMATAGLLIIAIVLLLGGITFGERDNLGSMFNTDRGFFYVFLMVPAMLIGFDVIPQSAEEMNIAPKNIGKMIVVCIILSLSWYVAITIGVGFAAPVEIRSSGIIPMADVISYLFRSEIFSTIIILAGILGILTSWNGFFMGATRLIFAMGRAGILPAIFARVHHKYKTPETATLFVGAMCMLAPFFGRNALVWFINTSSLCALIAYCLVIVSFIILRKKDRELARPFKVRGGTVFGIITLIVSVIYFCFYMLDNFSVDELSPEFIITIVWITIGIAFSVGAEFSGKQFSDAEREIMVFGERFARKGDKNVTRKG